MKPGSCRSSVQLHASWPERREQGLTTQTVHFVRWERKNKATTATPVSDEHTPTSARLILSFTFFRLMQLIKGTWWEQRSSLMFNFPVYKKWFVGLKVALETKTDIKINPLILYNPVNKMEVSVVLTVRLVLTTRPSLFRTPDYDSTSRVQQTLGLKKSSTSRKNTAARQRQRGR